MNPVRNFRIKSLKHYKATNKNRGIFHPVGKKLSNGASGVKYDIITFGSAAVDIFLRTKQFSIETIKEFTAQKGACFPFSSKVELEKLRFFSGGGGTNTAATFALQGFKTAYCGMVGYDFAGHEILKELKELGINTQYVFKTQKRATNLSVIFSLDRERTCFVWREASEHLTKKEIPWQKLRKAGWFYLAPLSGKLSCVFKPLVDFGYQNKIKIFANPGNSQIELGRKNLGPIFKKIDILLLNQEEASLLTNIDYRKEKQVFKKLDELVPGLVIMTKGENGVSASDGKYLWEAKPLKIKVTEKTGAGDAFGSGFLANFIKTEEIGQALQFGIANANACIQKIGAKQGLLKKNQAWKKTKVVKTKL